MEETLIVVASSVLLATLLVLFLWSLSLCLAPVRSRSNRLRVVPRRKRFRRPIHPFTLDEPRFERAW